MPSRGSIFGGNVGTVGIYSTRPLSKHLPTPTDWSRWRTEPIVPFISAHRTTIGTGFLALSFVGNLMLQSFHSPLLGLSWAALAVGVLLTGVSIGNRKVFWSLVALLAFHALAIPGSLIWGTGNWELTAGVVLWMAPALLLYLANDASRVFAWLIPVFLAHAALIIIEGLTNWAIVGEVYVRGGGHNTGLANNPNLAAGFLIIGIIYLMMTPRNGIWVMWSRGRTHLAITWLAAPLLMALLFTGSRWGLVVAAVLLAAMALRGAISWRPLAGAIAVLVLTVVVLGLAGRGYQVAGYGSLAAVSRDVQTDVGARLAIPHIPSILPSGVAEHPGLHNVPLRIAIESGIIAAGLWVLITGRALANPSFDNNSSGFSKWQNILYRLTRRKTSTIVSPSPRNPAYPTVPHEAKPTPRPDQCRNSKSQHLPLPSGFNKPDHGITSNSAEDQRHQREPEREAFPKAHYRWILLALVMLSVLDYYTWMGHLGGFWWLLIGLLVKR